MTNKSCENCKFYDEDVDNQPCCSCVNKENFEADNNVGDKMQSKDIIKALECCIKSSHLGECFENKCPLISEKGCKVGKETLYPYALELIKNQQAEIEKLKGDLLESNIEIAELYKCKFSAEDVAQNIVIAKTEAYKEFADKLNDNAVWLENHKVIFKIYVDKTLEELTERKED